MGAIDDRLGADVVHPSRGFQVRYLRQGGQILSFVCILLYTGRSCIPMGIVEAHPQATIWSRHLRT